MHMPTGDHSTFKLVNSLKMGNMFGKDQHDRFISSKEYNYTFQSSDDENSGLHITVKFLHSCRVVFLNCLL